MLNWDGRHVALVLDWDGHHGHHVALVLYWNGRHVAGDAVPVDGGGCGTPREAIKMVAFWQGLICADSQEYFNE